MSLQCEILTSWSQPIKNEPNLNQFTSPPFSLLPSCPCPPLPPLSLSRSQESVSKHFSGDVLRVAERCWQQIHPKISEAIEVHLYKYYMRVEMFSPSHVLYEGYPGPVYLVY